MKIKQQLLLRGLTSSLLGITALAVGMLTMVRPSYSQTSSETTPETQTAPEAQPSGETTEVSQQELEQFAQAFKQIQQIRQSSEAEMVKAVESEGLNPERFIEISQAQQNPESEEVAEVSNEEQQGFENARAKISEIQEQSESQMEQAIQAEGLDLSRFNEIYAALQQDPSLREQVQQMILN